MSLDNLAGCNSNMQEMWLLNCPPSMSMHCGN